MKKIKFSIIIPVYNTEEYLVRCLDSVVNQTYSNYEIVVVNDGSMGNCDDIVKNYCDIIYIKQDNAGLSVARNNGVRKSSGDYFFFLDSDDYIDKDLLLNISNNINNEDIVRYQTAIDIDGNIIKYLEEGFNNLNGEQAFNRICKYKYVENATLYFIKRKFWIINRFCFKEGRYHEDFGLIPEVIFRASSVSSIPFVGYYYYQRGSSIMNDKNPIKEYRKAKDMFEQGMEEIQSINTLSGDKKIFNSFIVNSIFIKVKKLNKLDKKEFIDKIRDNNLINYILDDTFKRKFKKLYLKFLYKL